MGTQEKVFTNEIVSEENGASVKAGYPLAFLKMNARTNDLLTVARAIDSNNTIKKIDSNIFTLPDPLSVDLGIFQDGPKKLFFHYARIDEKALHEDRHRFESKLDSFIQKYALIAPIEGLVSFSTAL